VLYVSEVREYERLGKIRVLLADDSRQVLEYVRTFLSDNCCEVTGLATDGQAAVDAAAQLLPDVVVLDVSMPVLDGIRAATRIRETNPSIQIVFLTVTKDPDIYRAAMETRAAGYVLKARLATDLVPAIKLAHDGGRFMSPGCE